MTGQQEDRQIRVERVHFTQKIETVAVGQRNVEQHELGGLPEIRPRGLKRRREQDAVTEIREVLAERPTNQVFIVDDQDQA